MNLIKKANNINENLELARLLYLYSNSSIKAYDIIKIKNKKQYTIARDFRHKKVKYKTSIIEVINFTYYKNNSNHNVCIKFCKFNNKIGFVNILEYTDKKENSDIFVSSKKISISLFKSILQKSYDITIMRDLPKEIIRIRKRINNFTSNNFISYNELIMKEIKLRNSGFVEIRNFNIDKNIFKFEFSLKNPRISIRLDIYKNTINFYIDSKKENCNIFNFEKNKINYYNLKYKQEIEFAIETATIETLLYFENFLKKELGKNFYKEFLTN